MEACEKCNGRGYICPNEGRPVVLACHCEDGRVWARARADRVARLESIVLKAGEVLGHHSELMAALSQEERHDYANLVMGRMAKVER